MAFSFSGSCLCGALRFQAQGEPLFQGYCQCRDCRKACGGHSSAITMSQTDVVISGEFRFYGTKGNSGSVVHRNFCPSCGSSVFSSYPEATGVISLNAALLDEPEIFTPEVVLYSQSALPWDYIDPTVPRSEEMKTAKST